LRRVAAFGLADRIETRAQAVEDLTDVEQFGLAYVPQVFLPDFASTSSASQRSSLQWRLHSMTLFNQKVEGAAWRSTPSWYVARPHRSGCPAGRLGSGLDRPADGRRGSRCASCAGTGH
jgi:hypothetical protein